MKRNGFILVEALLGLFFIGLLATSVLPLLSFSFNNVRTIKYRDEMNYIGEMVAEKLKSESEFALKTISDLIAFGEVNYEDDDFDKSKYRCKLVNLYSSSRFIEYMVIVESKDGANVKSVQYISSTKR